MAATRRALTLTSQALAVVLVVGLFGLLVWKLFRVDGGNLKAAIRDGERPAAPDFTLRRLDRPGELTLSSLRGKAVVLNVWASWCRPCRQEAPVLEQTWRRYGPERLVVVGVDWRDLDSDARRFARKYGMTYPIVDDGRASLTEEYELTGVPETFVLDRDGRVLGYLAGGLDQDERRGEYDRLVEEALAS